MTPLDEPQTTSEIACAVADTPLEGPECDENTRSKERRWDGRVAMLTVDQTALELNVSRAHVYNLIAKRKIKSVKLGRCRRVPAAEVKRLAASL